MTTRQALSDYARIAGPAVSKVGHAVKTGRLVKGPCEECGSEDVQAHHPRGYDDDHALDVEWLCRPHHMARHGRPNAPSWARSGQARAYMVATRGPRDFHVSPVAHAYGPDSSPRTLFKTIQRVWSYLRTEEERQWAFALVCALASDLETEEASK